MIKRGSRGFTLIEMLVVIGIIAVLAAIIIPVYSRVQEKGRQTDCLAHLKAIGVAMRMYFQEMHGYPPPWDPVSKSGGITALVTTGCLSNWKALRCKDDPNANDPDRTYSSYNAYYNYWGYDAAGAPLPDGTAAETAYTDASYRPYAPDEGGYWTLGTTPAPPGATVEGMYNDRSQLLWDPVAGRTAAFPGLVNRSASDETVITRCPFHRTFFGTANEKDQVVYIGGDATQVLTRYEWLIQPLTQAD